MYCKKCGKEIIEDSNYCIYCGNECKDTKVIDENSSNTTSNNINPRMSSKSIIVIVIFILAIVLIVWAHDTYLLNNNILTKDIKYIISTFDTRVVSVEENFKYVEDGNGRTLGTFTYVSRPYNIYGYTITNQTYTSTIRIMFMKKHGTVEYAICPTDWLIKSPYDDFEDFKTQNNWGKAESLGLGSNSKTFQSK